MKKIIYLSLLLVFTWTITNAQVTYTGPAVGNVAGGVIKTTDEFFSTTTIAEPDAKKIRNKIEISPEPFFLNLPAPAENEILYIEDTNRENPSRAGEQTVLLKDFAGNPMGNSIPRILTWLLDQTILLQQ